MSSDTEIPQWEEILILRQDRDGWCERAGELLAEVGALRAVMAEMLNHVEPPDQNAELAIARWRERAGLGQP